MSLIRSHQSLSFLIVPVLFGLVLEVTQWL